MPELLPFRAVRPAADKAGMVTSQSYESYDREALLAELKHNAYSFLHIINPGYNRAEPFTPLQRFQKVGEKYHAFIEKGILERDPRPCYYLYELRTEENRFLGLFGATSTADYRAGLIRKHEETIARREAIFANYLEVVKFNAEPVLLMYRDNEAIRARLLRECNKNPLYDFRCTEGNRYRFWAIDAAETISWLRSEFMKMDAFYIADGHHRCASSNLLSERAKAANPEHSGREAHDYFMSCLLPESEVKIGSYTRLIKDLNGLSEKVFLQKISECFNIRKLGEEPPQNLRKNQFLMYLPGSFYFIALKQDCGKKANALDKLDAHILYSNLLNPVLNIEDLRNDKRIRYGYGKKKISLMKRKIDAGEYLVGFAMKPVSSAELREIADAGLVMPPKSTYIEPKMRSGLAIYEL
jgi:uncharacterized protein (DUF1015 family)